MTNKELEKYLNNLLNINFFKDYCPNGLQIEGSNEVKKIITGVSANLDLIQKAVQYKADAIIVHHGFFWKNENPVITGIKKNRIKLLLENNINLYAYHLPLDAHLTLGNNANLAKLLNIKNPKPIAIHSGDSLVWQGELNTNISELSKNIHTKLGRKPLVFGVDNKDIQLITWCSGGAQNHMDDAIEIGADCFITGEVSEQNPAIAKENNMVFIAAGHHATEKGGAQNLAYYLIDKFNLDCKFVDIKNIV